MNKILIITHSTYAEGIANAIKFFKYDIDNVYYINAYVEDQEFEKALIVKLNEIGTEDLIVLSDLLGGSVNQVALKLMNEYKYKLITGVNLPLVLELAFSQEKMNDEKIIAMIEHAKEQLIYMNKYQLISDDSEEL